MEVTYCAGCGVRIDAREIERGEVSKMGADYYCMKCAHAMGHTLEPGQTVPTTRPRASRPKISRAPTEAKGLNTTFVLLALGAAFLAAAVYVIHLVGSRGEERRSLRERQRPAHRRVEVEPPPPDEGAAEPRALFAPRIKHPAEHVTEFIPPPPAAPAVQELRPLRPADFLNAGPAGETPGDALVFEPVADTYVSPRASAVLGAHDRIEAGAGVGEGVRRTAYLRFELKGLPGKVVSAKLRLHCVNASRESGGDLLAGQGGWSKAALSYDRRPVPGGEPVARLGPVSMGVEYELDVTPLVRGEGVVELVLDSMFEDGAGYGSRESANPPRLALVCERPQEEPAREEKPPPEAEPGEVLKKVVALVHRGEFEEAREEAESLGGPAGGVLAACVEVREKLARLATKALLEAGRDEQLTLRFGGIPLKGFVARVEGRKIWMHAPQGASVPGDIRKLAMEDTTRHSGLDGSLPEGGRQLGRAWLVDGNAAQALAYLSVAKVGGLDVSKEMELARSLVEREERPSPAAPARREHKEAPGRVAEGLVAFYPFDGGKGQVVPDKGGSGVPLDLKMSGTVSWLPGRNGVRISSGSSIKNTSPASRLRREMLKTGAFTFEVWCKPGNTSQKGPARIVSYSKDGSNRNFTIGQEQQDIQVRLRTTTSPNANGRPYMDARSVVTTRETHFVVTFSVGGAERLYVNGREIASLDRTGSLSNWDASHHYVIGNEATDDRPWAGEVYLAAVYKRALTPEEILRNFRAGSRAVGTGKAKAGAGILSPGRVVKKINFQTKGARVPEGYEPDWGEVFDENRGYGWTEDRTKATRLRSRKDPVLGTTVFAGSATRAHTWEMELANGTFFLSAVCGDATCEQGPHGVKAEGIRLIWDEITRVGAYARAEEIPVEVGDGRLALEVGAVGSTLVSSDNTTDTGICSLVVKEAEQVRGADAAGRLWFAAAADATRFSGATKTSAQHASGDDLDTARDSLSPGLVYMTAKAGPKHRPDSDIDHACYTFRLEEEGEYYLWGRLYFPGAPGSNDPNSFWARADKGPARKFGNSLDMFRKWHWGGDGEAERGRQGPVKLGRLATGVHQLLVINRDGEGVRLDVLCLTPDARYRPSDKDVLKVLPPPAGEE